MPSCTALPYTAMMARVAGSAAGIVPLRRCQAWKASVKSSAGTKYANSMRQGRADKSCRAMVRNISAGTKR